jgi:hypothetical protein
MLSFLFTDVGVSTAMAQRLRGSYMGVQADHRWLIQAGRAARCGGEVVVTPGWGA